VIAVLSLGQDPLGFLLHLITAVLAHFVDTARVDLTPELDKYLLTTTDVSSPAQGAFTARDALRRMNLGMVVATDLLIVVVLTYACIRMLFERGAGSHYSMRVILPRLLSAIVLIHFSLPFMQMAIDLNNALGSVAMTLGDGFKSPSLPWTVPLGAPSIAQISASQNLFQALFAVALVVALVVLMVTYIIRYALLGILIVTAPMAALCTVLPETLTYSRTWLRLFLATVFMQALQLVVLRVAMVTAFDPNGSLVQTIYALATLWIMLKVPGALSTASHLETKGSTMAHTIENAMHRALVPARHVAQHT
jgi:hypothetical protein